MGVQGYNTGYTGQHYLPGQPGVTGQQIGDNVNPDAIDAGGNPPGTHLGTQNQGTYVADAPTPPPAPAPGPAPTPAPQPGLLSDPGPYETWAHDHLGGFDDPTSQETLYGAHGGDLVNQPSASEQLYSQGIHQLDPYYDYAQKTATRSINDAAAAHGGFSRAALDAIGNSNDNLRGQQARDMAARAQAADAAKLGRYGAAFGEAQGADTSKLNRLGAGASVASTWQDKEESRVISGLTGQAGISSQETAAIEKFYSNLGDISKLDTESINAALQAAGIDPNSAFAKDIVAIAPAVAKAYLGRK